MLQYTIPGFLPELLTHKQQLASSTRVFRLVVPSPDPQDTLSCLFYQLSLSGLGTRAVLSYMNTGRLLSVKPTQMIVGCTIFLNNIVVAVCLLQFIFYCR